LEYFKILGVPQEGLEVQEEAVFSLIWV